MATVGRIVCPLKWQANVDERSECLDETAVLRVIEKVLLAALVCWIPIEDFEIGCICHDRCELAMRRAAARRRRRRRCKRMRRLSVSHGGQRNITLERHEGNLDEVVLYCLSVTMVSRSMAGGQSGSAEQHTLFSRP